LLHGDLLGQNILLAVDGPHHVIDWEYARRGDPAYDLAIVTRGIKQPFHIDRGLDRLRDAYRAHGGHDILDDPCSRCARARRTSSWRRTAHAHVDPAVVADRERVLG
jgi:thiamine kinase-like enzyme